MWMFILITILQTFLLFELSLLFLRVLGDARRSNCLGKSCTFVQTIYLLSCKLVGGLFMLLALFVSLVSLVELFGLLSPVFWS